MPRKSPHSDETVDATSAVRRRTKNRRPPKKAATPKEGPAIILVQPQLGENIGMVARAMLNCDLFDLRLVAPRDGWPNERAVATASGASAVLERARVFDTTADAIADLETVFATTARARDMNKDVATPHTAAVQLRGVQAAGGKSGILFGRESVGLHNDDIALADSILMVPLNPAFSSLNLAQCVLLVSYEWYQAGLDDKAFEDSMEIRGDTRPANKQELGYLFEHLETELDACGFLREQDKRPSMVRNLRNIFQRARLTEQEVRTLRGVISGLTRHARRKANKTESED